jgi:hypothetical protein
LCHPPFIHFLEFFLQIVPPAIHSFRKTRHSSRRFLLGDSCSTILARRFLLGDFLTFRWIAHATVRDAWRGWDTFTEKMLDSMDGHSRHSLQTPKQWRNNGKNHGKTMGRFFL